MKPLDCHDDETILVGSRDNVDCAVRAGVDGLTVSAMPQARYRNARCHKACPLLARVVRTAATLDVHPEACHVLDRIL